MTNTSSPTCAASRRSACPVGTKPCTTTVIESGPLRGVAADQRDVMLRGEFGEAVGKAVDERAIGFRQRQREQRPGRRRAHRGEVAEIDRERFPAEVARAGLCRKMHAGDQRIGADDEVVARRDTEDRGVVADAELHVVARDRAARADEFDQVEFRHDARSGSVNERRARYERAAAYSVPRQTPARLSSTPLT